MERGTPVIATAISTTHEEEKVDHPVQVAAHGKVDTTQQKKRMVVKKLMMQRLTSAIPRTISNTEEGRVAKAGNTKIGGNKRLSTESIGKNA